MNKRQKPMVAFVKVSKEGALLEIKEVLDKYRYEPYKWDED